MSTLLAPERPQNPFATPPGSGHSTPAAAYQRKLEHNYFKSRRLDRDHEIDKPWLSHKDPYRKWASLLPLIGIFLGIAAGGVFTWNRLRSVVEFEYCMIYEDDFSAGFDETVWTKEAQIDGYGNGQFEETTTTDENVFIVDGMLHIKPTLQDEKLINEDNIVNLTASGLCTGTEWYQCWTSTNTTNGTIVNPVKSGRIHTKPDAARNKKGVAIRYGRIEVEAKLPAGDWLWPAIWLLPVEDTYGPWPASGEIDIVESRGNNYSYTARGGSQIASSTIHWGPDSENDAWWRTYGQKKAFLSSYADQFHTYGLEWTPKYLYAYIDSRLNQVFYTKFDRPFWSRGHFPLASVNGTGFVDLWSQTGDYGTPFDKPFYLIMNVAVGSQNGWFEDGKHGKPWVDKSPTARKDFWNARDQWYPTWEKGGAEMQVRRVTVMQQKGFEGC